MTQPPPSTTSTTSTTSTSSTSSTSTDTSRITLTRAEVTRLANDLRLACMRVSRRVRYESEPELAPHLFSVLCRLEDEPRTNQELASMERVSAPSMKRTTSGLVEAGFVSRADDPADRRQVILSITSHGRKAVKRIRRQRDEWMLERFDDLTPEELALLQQASALLSKVASR